MLDAWEKDVDDEARKTARPPGAYDFDFRSTVSFGMQRHGMRAAIALSLGLQFVVPVLTQDAPAATHLAFVGARLIDGTGAAPVTDG